MTQQPRRAADTSVEVTTYPDASPRRGRGAGALRPVVQRAIAPLAVVGLVAVTTVFTFVPVGDRTTDVADPLLHAEVQLGVSRHRERGPLPAAPAAGPSVAPTTPVADLPTPSVPPSTVPVTPAETPVAESATPSEPVASETPVQADDAVQGVAAAAASAEPVEPTPEVEPAPEVDYSQLAADAGTLWSTSSVNIRTGPGTDFDVLGTIAPGRSVTATEADSDGWQQVNRDGVAGWIKSTYLSETEPPKTSGSGASGVDSSSCSRGSGIEGGLTSRGVTVLRAVCNQFPGISSFGGYRGGGGSYHSSGRAIDAMISGEAGWEVARWVRANASALGVTEVIYAQKIWTSQRAGDGWRGMSDRGSASANHYDHVHISVR